MPHASKEEKREQELWQQEQGKEINMLEQARGSDRVRHEETKCSERRISVNLEQIGEDKSLEQTKNNILRCKTLQKLEVAQNQIQTHIGVDEQGIEHAPKRTKLGE